jgi:large subunit ribosomal protein L18
MQVKKKVYRRRKRIVKGTNIRPRLVVFRSNKNIFGHLVDDETNKVLLGLSSLNPDLQAELKKIEGKVGKAELVGKKLAEKALAADFKKVVFDRNGYLFHGRVKAFADGARAGGLEF